MNTFGQLRLQINEVIFSGLRCGGTKLFCITKFQIIWNWIIKTVPYIVRCFILRQRDNMSCLMGAFRGSSTANGGKKSLQLPEED